MFVRLALPIMLLTSPALAQQEPAPIAAREGSAYKHKHSGFNFPPTLIGLKRVQGREVVAPQLDLFFNYRAADDSEEISVYVYRMTSGSVPLWFDVSRTVVETRKETGSKTAWGTPTAFAPPGQASASALQLGWTITGSDLRSTTLTLIPMGDWLVKIRHSSVAHEVASLQRRTSEAVAALGWPKRIAAAPAAAAIADCTDTLALSGDAKPVAANGANALVEAVLAQMAGNPASRKKAADAAAAPPVQWCADRSIVNQAGLYRPQGTRDRYLAPLSDSGIAVWTQPSAASAMLAEKDSPSWSVSLLTAGKTYNFAGRDRLPLPSQVDAILKERPATSAATWGDRQISVDSGAMN
ncbi:hypothetical protein K9B35_12700 [Sphingomonas sp. R647]|uniref:hypothetical protein n=1 Tax=Sphingomonas sp. R647 TaxID=2875233 RepID=UPI001CD7A99D|nr:hypothetical protein [Sphingomonas sp. R647]MCA1198828.1 hypothetical protein [Sphingomonas sp. R647]